MSVNTIKQQRNHIFVICKRDEPQAETTQTTNCSIEARNRRRMQHELGFASPSTEGSQRPNLININRSIHILTHSLPPHTQTHPHIHITMTSQGVRPSCTDSLPSQTPQAFSLFFAILCILHFPSSFYVLQ